MNTQNARTPPPIPPTGRISVAQSLTTASFILRLYHVYFIMLLSYSRLNRFRQKILGSKNQGMTLGTRVAVKKYLNASMSNLNKEHFSIKLVNK